MEKTHRNRISVKSAERKVERIEKNTAWCQTGFLNLPFSPYDLVQVAFIFLNVSLLIYKKGWIKSTL